jgi:hypothetical protein
MSKKDEEKQSQKRPLVTIKYDSSSRTAVHKAATRSIVNKQDVSLSPQEKGVAHMQFVSDLTAECQPLRVKRLLDLNQKSEKKLTFDDIKHLDQPLEKCIKEYCAAANNIAKSQRGHNNVAQYSPQSVEALDKLQAQFIKDVHALKPQKTLDSQAADKYNRNMYTVVNNVLLKHHREQVSNTPKTPRLS